MKQIMWSAVPFKRVDITLFLYYLLLAAIIPNSESRISPQSSSGVWTNKCPCRQCDTDGLGRKRVICDEGGREEIPTHYMDKNAHILIFTAPQNNPNQVTIGRIFLEFESLQEIYITYSNVPAIGDSSFWPGRRVQLLDLSFNNITILRDADFNGLTNLMTLNLSDNNLAGSPSAPFRFLTNLTRLSLARNKLTKLVPRLFYRLEKLEFLDLSGNPLLEIEPDDVKDLKPLRQLYLVGCQISKLHSLIYQSLPNLEVLDLRDNQFESIASNEFVFLKKLNNLFLDGNRLTVINENSFNSLRLNRLSLSRNNINSFKLCAFCNSSIKDLDISNNKFTKFETDITEPLSTSLVSLNAENNYDLQESSTSVSNLIRPLKMIRKISLSSMNLDDSLPSNLFLTQRESITSINFSGNKFVNISAKLFEGLKRLEVLDLSANSIYALSESVLEIFNSLPSLTLLYLDLNPWSCYRCHILPLMEWIQTSPPAYVNACQKDEKGSCAKCVHPPDLIGKELHSMEEWNLEWCADPTIQLRISTTEPNVGLVLALLIIISLIIVIIAVIILYRKQGATYYTHEDELRFDDKTVFSVSETVRNFANATASPPLSPDSPTSTRSSTSSSSPTTNTRATSPHSTQSQSSLPATPTPPSSSSSPPQSSTTTKPKILL